MALRKCPRCELNYIKEDEKYCNVCRREMKNDPEADDSMTICSECGENPAVKGSDLCAICLREVRRQELQSNGVEPMTNPESLVLNTGVLDEDMEVPLSSDDIPESELNEIDKELSNGSEDIDEDFSEEEEATR